MDTNTNPDSLERTVAAACGLLEGNDAIRAVHVLATHRPTYSQLMRFRKIAQAHGASMTVIGSGEIVLRSRRSAPPLVVGKGPGLQTAGMSTGGARAWQERVHTGSRGIAQGHSTAGWRPRLGSLHGTSTVSWLCSLGKAVFGDLGAMRGGHR